MKITNQNGNFFALDILGYEFPDIEHDLWDSDWLVIRFTFTSGDRTLSVTGADLTTFEVQNIIDWFNELADEIKILRPLSFTEPFVEFKLIEDQNECLILRVDCALWSHTQIFESKETISIDFPVDQVNFRELAEVLQDQLAKFPQRAIYEQKQVSQVWLSEIFSKIKAMIHKKRKVQP